MLACLCSSSERRRFYFQFGVPRKGKRHSLRWCLSLLSYHGTQSRPGSPFPPKRYLGSAQSPRRRAFRGRRTGDRGATVRLSERQRAPRARSSTSDRRGALDLPVFVSLTERFDRGRDSFQRRHGGLFSPRVPELRSPPGTPCCRRASADGDTGLQSKRGAELPDDSGQNASQFAILWGGFSAARGWPWLGCHRALSCSA